MKAREKQLGDALVKQLCLPYTEEEELAFRCAEAFRCGTDGEASRLIVCRSPQFMRLVADAWEEKGRFKPPTPTCMNIVSAWRRALFRRAQTASGIRVDVNLLKKGPTIFEVRLEFVRLFVPEKERPRDWSSREGLSRVAHNNLPTRQSFEETLRRFELPFRLDKVGRPRNSQPK
jgi:hypothetical protein